MAKKLLCAGFGQLNSRVAERWHVLGGDTIALRRSQPATSSAIEQISIDLAQQSWPDVGADCVVVALSAAERSLEAYREAYVEPLLRLQASLAHWQRLPEKIIVVSSTRVYGFDDGRFVDDETPAQTDDEYGQILLHMETIATQLPVATTVVRLSGIYAPHRNWLERMALKASDETLEKNHWTNRIHIDDAAAAIIFLLEQVPQERLANSYIVSDTQPVAALEMYNYFRERAGVAKLSKKLPVNRGKHLTPSRLKALGFEWQYPNAFSGGYET